MNNRMMFGRELESKVRQGITLKDIGQWIFEVMSDYIFDEQANTDTELLNLMMEIIELGKTPYTEDVEERILVIIDELLHAHNEATLVKLGLEMKQWLRDGGTPEQIREWTLKYLREYFNVYDGSEADHLHSYLNDICEDCGNPELTKEEVALLSRLLIQQIPDSYEEMKKRLFKEK